MIMMVNEMMIRRLRPSTLGLTGTLLVGLAVPDPDPVSGQSFNIDIDTTSTSITGNGPPSSAFGAAGLPGVWNSLTGGSMGLVRIDGVASSATITRSTTATTSGFNNASTTGDAEKLMDDYQRFDAVPFTVTIAHLQAGHYRVLTYANRVNGSGNRSSVSVAGSVSTNPQLIGGALSLNTFTRGVTHAEHVVAVTGSGSITITLDNSPPSGSGGLNGIQLVQSTPTRLYVDASRPGGGDGLSWATAMSNLQAALSLASSLNNVTEVWVARGTYRAGNAGGPGFSVGTGQRLYGGFAGTETTLAQRDPTANVTLLSGDVNGDDQPAFVNRTDNAGPVLMLAGAALIDGCTVSGGRSATGGGVVLSGNGGRVDRCVVRDNEADLGGGVALEASGFVVRSHIEGNRAGAGAGFWSSANITMVSCMLASNSCGGFGGAGFINGSARLDQCVLSQNTGAASGGVLVVGSVTASNCTFVRNGAAFLRAAGSTISIRNSYLLGDRAADFFGTGPGVLLGSDPFVEKVNCVESVPIALAWGAGVDGVAGTGDDDYTPLPNAAGVDSVTNLLPSDAADLDGDSNVTESVPHDFRGAPRVQDTLGVGSGALADVGAIETSGTVRTANLASGAALQWSSAGSWSGGVPTPQHTAAVAGSGPTRPVLWLSANASARQFVASGRLQMFRDGDIPRTLLISGVSSTPSPAVVLTGDIEFGPGSLSTSSDVRVGDATDMIATSVVFHGPGAGPSLLSCRDLVVASGLVRHGSTTLSASGTMRVLPLGTLHSAGTLSGDLEVQGRLIAESARITGDLEWRRSASTTMQPSLSINADAATPADAYLSVDGSIDLEGTVSVTLDQSVLPAVGASWTLLTGGSRSGVFQTAFLPGDATKVVRLIYQDSARSSALIAQVDTRDNVQSLNPPRGFAVPGSPSAAAVGDLDGDGFSELAVVVPDPVNPTGANGKLKILFNLGSTGTSWNGYAAVISEYSTQFNPSSLCVADFDGDNRLDIAVTNRNGTGGANGTVCVFRNLGGGSLGGQIGITTQIGAAPSAIGAEDITGDGKPDLVVANSADGSLTILQNTSAGLAISFAAALPSPTTVGLNPVALFAADLDADGDIDIGTANRDSGDVSLLFNQGTVIAREGSGERAWSGVAPVRHIRVESEPSSIQPGNIDNGKETEIVVTNAGSGTVSVLLRGPGGEYSSSSGPIGTAPSSVVLIDIDNDADDRPDILAVTQDGGTSQVAVLQTELGPNGEILLTNSPDITPPDPPSLILADDVNGDGTTDLIAVNPDTVAMRDSDTGETLGTRGAPQTIKVQLNYKPCPTDLNYDRVVNVADLTFFLGRFGQTATPGSLAFRADFNKDGVVNTRDLTFFLNRFGIACP